MAKILEDISRTFAEYLLIPRLTRRDQHIDAIDLSAPLSREGVQGQENENRGHASLEKPGLEARIQHMG